MKSPGSRVKSGSWRPTRSAPPRVTSWRRSPRHQGPDLTSSGGYVGPAGQRPWRSPTRRAWTSRDFGTDRYSIPVQIGPPAMRRPEADIPVSAGGRSRHRHPGPSAGPGCPWHDLDDSSPSSRPGRSSPTAPSWRSRARVAVRSRSRRRERAPGTGTISVTTAGMEKPAEIGVRVFGKASGEAGSGDPTDPANVPPRPAPDDRHRPQQGRSQTLDVSAYLDSPLAAPQCAITAARVEAGQGSRSPHSGCALTPTATTQPRRRRPSGSPSPTGDPSRVADGRVSDDARRPRGAHGCPGPAGPSRRPAGDRLLGSPTFTTAVCPSRGYKIACGQPTVHVLAPPHHRPGEQQGLHLHRRRLQRRR